ncbi:MAG: hypothetical protein N2109_03135 [Fimbriimonadales bacterium]|nr:hypothetical protein [Fimbriimonadales bacterium]
MPGLEDWVRRHPRLRIAGSLPFPELRVGSRSVVSGGPGEGLYGLPELVDNNPIVCAARVVVPEPAATLAWIALGPAAKAGLLQRDESDSAVLLRFGGLPAERLADALAVIGWTRGTEIEWRKASVENVATLEAFLPLAGDCEPSEVAEAYEEAFGRSFFVRRVSPCEALPHRLAGTPRAEYWIELSPSSEPMLRVVVAADRRGKLGGAQLVQSLNVMFGWEETTGLEEAIP